MAIVDIDAVIAYVPGSMQKRCHYSIYLMQQRQGTGRPSRPGFLEKMWITAILSSQWFERES